MMTVILLLFALYLICLPTLGVCFMFLASWQAGGKRLPFKYAWLGLFLGPIGMLIIAFTPERSARAWSESVLRHEAILEANEGKRRVQTQRYEGKAMPTNQPAVTAPENEDPYADYNP